MKRAMGIYLGLVFGASLAAEPITVRTRGGEEVRGELSRVAPEGLVMAMSDGIKKIKWSDLPEDVVAKYRGSASAAEDSELTRLRQEVSRLRDENDMLRLRIGAMAGTRPSASAATARDASVKYERHDDTPAARRASLELLEGQMIPESRARLEKLERLSNYKKAEKKERWAEFLDGHQYRVVKDQNEEKRDQEILALKAEIASMEAEVAKLKCELGK